MPGVVGRTGPGRLEIGRRIEAVREAKARALGARLTPADVVVATGDSAADLPRRPCGRCRSRLPESEFYARKDGYRNHTCKTCTYEKTARYLRSPGGRARLTARADRIRERKAKYMRRMRGRWKEAGVPNPYQSGLRCKLLALRRQARHRLKRATDPAKAAYFTARIADIDREIGREVDRELVRSDDAERGGSR